MLKKLYNGHINDFSHLGHIQSTVFADIKKQHTPNRPVRDVQLNSEVLHTNRCLFLPPAVMPNGNRLHPGCGWGESRGKQMAMCGAFLPLPRTADSPDQAQDKII